MHQGVCEKKLEVGKVPEGKNCTYRVTVTTTGAARVLHFVTCVLHLAV